LGTALTVLLVVGVLTFGLIDFLVIQPRQPVAVVNGQKILRRDFHTRVRLALTPGSDPISVGNQILNDMIDEEILRQEAERLEIVVLDDDIDRVIQESFGYFAQGTPTLSPTRTADPLEIFLETPTLTAESTPTSGLTATPRPTPTAYTYENFEENLSIFLETIDERYNATENDYRTYLEAQLYRERVRESFEDQVEEIQEQVLLQHIQVATREEINAVLTRLEEGEVWEDLTVELSEDLATKDTGGNLGWLTLSAVLQRFGDLALQVFQVPRGETVGPLETSDGWHLLKVVDRAERPLEDFVYFQAVQDVFNSWLSDRREASDVVIMDDWDKNLPQAPPPNP
jgi:parvulin-like peptidyl-prolyl isomerase